MLSTKTTKTISNTTLNKWNEDDEKRWRVVERETKFEQIDVGSWTGQAAAIVNDIEVKSHKFNLFNFFFNRLNR